MFPRLPVHIENQTNKRKEDYLFRLVALNMFKVMKPEKEKYRQCTLGKSTKHPQALILEHRYCTSPDIQSCFIA